MNLKKMYHLAERAKVLVEIAVLTLIVLLKIIKISFARYSFYLSRKSLIENSYFLMIDLD